MLKPEDRFFAPSGDITPGGPSTWHIMDWDQRRLISVTMAEDLESEDPAIEQLEKHIDNLAPEVVQICVSSQGSLISASASPEDDETHCVYHPPVATAQRLGGVQVISRSDLEELDRLGPMVDLVRTLKSSEPEKKLVFKYYFLFQRISFVWHEMNLWMRLPKHPNIVPFDKIVVDELEGRCVGFTVVYIPGGTLEENRNRIFKLKWLYQLIEVIDELNLNLGIIHQDVALRNLLIDETTDSLMIFDFNFSSRIGLKSHQDSRNDIKGVLFTIYEFITRDDTLRAVRYEEQDTSAIEKDWVKHPDVQLDHPVSEYRDVLRKWCERRRAGKQIKNYKDAPNFIDWPDIPVPPPTKEVINYPSGPVEEVNILWHWRRTDLIDQGKAFLNWQRPPQSKLRPGDRLLETGEFIVRAQA